MNIKFDYVNAKNEKAKRNVLVIHENETNFAGIDLAKLSRSDQCYARKLFANKPVTPFPEKRTKINYTDSRLESIVKQAWRNFKKSNVR